MQLKSNVFWLVAFGLSGADTPSYPARGRGGERGQEALLLQS